MVFISFNLTRKNREKSSKTGGKLSGLAMWKQLGLGDIALLKDIFRAITEKYAGEKFVGPLSMVVIFHPNTLTQPQVKKGLKTHIDIRYIFFTLFKFIYVYNSFKTKK